MATSLPTHQATYVRRWRGDYIWATRHSVHSRRLTRAVVMRATACVIAKYGLEGALCEIEGDAHDPEDNEIAAAERALFVQLEDPTHSERKTQALSLRRVSSGIAAKHNPSLTLSAQLVLSCLADVEG